MTELVEAARQTVPEFFRADPDVYTLFTANASAARKLVGESYPFGSESRLLLTDNPRCLGSAKTLAGR